MQRTTTEKRGLDLLRDPHLNKGTAFTREEREELGILGLLPDIVSTPDMQVKRIEAHIDSLPTDLDKYVYLSDLQERNEVIFYRILMANPVKYMPVVYTPTVGLACQTFGRIYRRPKGLFVSARHRGKIAKVLQNWEETDVRFIVVTDGERILGLGDLGAQGMGIPVGKLALYTACAGVPPQYALPIVLDVGTNNEELQKDPFYIGLPQARLTGDEYASFIEEFVCAIEEVFPGACIQWEDFANHNAGEILERYRNRIASFNDDIQGTAATGVAGVIAALRFTNRKLSDQTYLFFGAGSAGIGIADLLSTAMLKDGLTIEEARKRCWLVDSKGLVESSRTDLSDSKKKFAHDFTSIDNLLDAARELKATALIGTSTIPKSFTQDVIEQMAANTERPIIFPYSNPTSKSECSAEEAYTWTNGKVIFASGSPFPPCTVNGKTFVPGQGNNVYIFPAVGLAILAAKPTTIPDKAFSRAARTLAKMVSQEQFDKGLIYPPMADIRESSIVVAIAVTEYFFEAGLATVPKPDDVAEYVRSISWKAEY
ncbi:MAG: NAD-dependent malic enzyme [Ignavibacteria bacterium]|nr:NAD-dependent malic enzyme [Ignavibacteria bacterium]